MNKTHSKRRDLGQDARSLIAAADVLADLDMTVIAAVSLISSPFIECHKYFFETILEKCNPEGWNAGPTRDTGFMGQVYRTPDHVVPKLKQFLENIDSESVFADVLDTCTGDTPMHMMVRKQWNTEAAWAFADTFLQEWEEMDFASVVNREGETVMDMVEMLPQDSQFRQKFEARVEALQNSEDDTDDETPCHHENCCPCCRHCEVMETDDTPVIYTVNRSESF